MILAAVDEFPITTMPLNAPLVHWMHVLVQLSKMFPINDTLLDPANDISDDVVFDILFPINTHPVITRSVPLINLYAPTVTGSYSKTFPDIMLYWNQDASLIAI